MSIADNVRIMLEAHASGPATLSVAWSDGVRSDIAIGDLLRDRSFAALRDPATLARVEVGDWGHSLVWPGGIELGADALWLMTLSATGHDDTRKFLEWRLRHALSLSGAAAALGVSRRMVAYYSNGEKKVPRPILLACRGWEASLEQDRAA